MPRSQSSRRNAARRSPNQRKETESWQGRIMGTHVPPPIPVSDSALAPPRGPLLCCSVSMILPVFCVHSKKAGEAGPPSLGASAFAKPTARQVGAARRCKQWHLGCFSRSVVLWPLNIGDYDSRPVLSAVPCRPAGTVRGGRQKEEGRDQKANARS